jgi:hypothetical protein
MLICHGLSLRAHTRAVARQALAPEIVEAVFFSRAGGPDERDEGGRSNFARKDPPFAERDR